MVKIKDNQYTVENARRKSKPMEFVLAITRTVKTTNMPVFNQTILIYTGIKLEFRRDLFKPTEKTTMDSCLQELKDNKEIWWGITIARSRFLTIHRLTTSRIEMLATISARTGNQVRIIISILEDDQVVMGMGIQQLFREQLDSITSYFVRFNTLFFINFKSVFANNSFSVPVFSTGIQADRTKLVEVRRTVASRSGNNNNPQPLEEHQLCR